MPFINVLFTPFINTPESSKALTILVISFKSLSENFTVLRNPYIFSCIAASVALIAALNPRGGNMFFPHERAGFINFSKNLASIDPKAPPDFIILFICVLLNFASVDILFSTFSLNLFICVCVRYNSWSN